MGRVTIDPIRRFYAVAAGLAAVAGFLLFPLAGETDRFFSWTIEPPLSAAFMGAAYWAALVLLAWAARQREWALARTAMPAVAAIAALLLVTTLIHLDKFDLDSLFGWFWLVVYCLVTPLLAWADQATGPRERSRSSAGSTRSRRPCARCSPSSARLLLGFGAALYAAPAGRSVGVALGSDPAHRPGHRLVPDRLRRGGRVRDLGERRVAPPGARVRVRDTRRPRAARARVYSDDVTASGAGVAAYVAFWAVSLALGVAGLLLLA